MDLVIHIGLKRQRISNQELKNGRLNQHVVGLATDLALICHEILTATALTLISQSVELLEVSEDPPDVDCLLLSEHFTGLDCSLCGDEEDAY